jgi:hypothetical protein
MRDRSQVANKVSSIVGAACWRAGVDNDSV